MRFLGLKQQKFSGRSAGDWVLFCLIAVIAMLGLYAVGRSIDVQSRVANTFQGWYEDTAGYSKALEDQKASGKPMLVYFYASWCPHCKKFTAQVLSDDKMKTFVKNYPHVRVAPDNGQAEKDLMHAYGAQGYPSFFVVMPDGHRTLIETYADDHLKTADEFIDSIRAITGESASPEAAPAKE